MWCDNCLLVLPLRAGALAWNVVIAVYSLAASVLLLKYGQFLFFFYPEWFIYGGIGIAICVLACIQAIALSTRSYTWVKVCQFLWPFAIVMSAIRAVFIVWELSRYKDSIAHECKNVSDAGDGNSASNPMGIPISIPISIPVGICRLSWQTLVAVFVISLLADLGFQMYAFFLNWRFKRRLEKQHNRNPLTRI